MTPEIQAGAILGFMIALALFFAWRTGIAIHAFIDFSKSWDDFVRSKPIDKRETCQSKPHSWEDITLAVRHVEPGKYLVCKECGVISGTEYMLNKAGVKQLNQSIEIKRLFDEETKKYNAKVAEGVKVIRDRWVNANLLNLCTIEDPKKMRANLEAFSKIMVSATGEVKDKIASETRAQDELSERYKNWGSSSE